MRYSKSFGNAGILVMAKSRKQIAFDLDTKALEIYYPSENWRGSYEIIKRHMQKNGFQRDCREANIGREHSKNYIFDKNADIKPRNE